ncbi:hypothetical protein L13192_00971 [Pyrenophora tritici-repentis]|uniref:Uncharacterized protein n=2 Tax=Pyrenophora tritici-repentis TaxID=45151 RepID=A0A922SRH7_9PLEO|nr:uncharacterized protein PTRG_01525 [Pyrenophora tritici-repentis Pt-1C-BFP]EDU40963.1 predicted protein [Pyrenophora tritici-repentis Pt-1C-BFP]KAI1513656.1 hypothetical protein Ptr86124_007558 [Pyrenophora tritici-repentis]KAI1674224.1 hypothetical protein L13192_00971 [Pyrenophora tritici-repentis]KAI1688668.1 hypothetical protein KJE20_01846 [Pyrenophora tritici-repentis]
MSPHSPNTDPNTEPNCSSSPSITTTATTTSLPTDSPPPYTRTDPQPQKSNSSPPAYLPHLMPLPLRQLRQHSQRQHAHPRPRARDSDLESLTEFLPWITHSPTTTAFTPPTTSNATPQLQPQPARPRPTLAPLYIPPPVPASTATEASPTETNIPFTNHYVLSTQSLHMYQQQSFAGSTRTLVTPLRPSPHRASRSTAPRGARNAPGGVRTARVVFIEDEGVVRERDGVGRDMSMKKNKGGRGSLGLSICSWVLVGLGIMAIVGFIVGTVFMLREKAG